MHLPQYQVQKIKALVGAGVEFVSMNAPVLSPEASDPVTAKVTLLTVHRWRLVTPDLQVFPDQEYFSWFDKQMVLDHDAVGSSEGTPRCALEHIQRCCYCSYRLHFS